MKGETFLEHNTMINYRLDSFFTLVIKNVIESNMKETPEKIPTFIAINNMLNQLNDKIKSDDITNIINEELLNEILDEIKSSI